MHASADPFTGYVQESASHNISCVCAGKHHHVRCHRNRKYCFCWCFVGIAASLEQYAYHDGTAFTEWWCWQRDRSSGIRACWQAVPSCRHTMRAELIGHFQSCMTEIYLHIDARMADYIRTHPYQATVLALLVTPYGAAVRPSTTTPTRCPHCWCHG